MEGHPVILEGVILEPRVELQPFVLLGVRPLTTGSDLPPLRIGHDSVIRSHSVFYLGSTLGFGFKSGHGVLIREFCAIGNDCSVGTGSILEHHVTVGNGVRIHSGAFIPEYSMLEDGCWIGPRVVFTNAKYPSTPHTKSRLAGVTVRKGAKIGAGSVLLPGITVGEDAIVGAGSVVTKDVPKGSVVAGNPAKVTGKVKDLRYPDNGEAVYGEPE